MILGLALRHHQPAYQGPDAVNVSLETIPDPANSLSPSQRVRPESSPDYEKFLQELTAYFPHERQGIRFYDECWKVFNYLNRMELLFSAEPRYLTRYFPAPVGLSWFGEVPAAERW